MRTDPPRSTLVFSIVLRLVQAGLAAIGVPAMLAAQQPARDTTARDSLARKSTRLEAVTITTTRAARDEPAATTNVAPA